MKTKVPSTWSTHIILVAVNHNPILLRWLPILFWLLAIVLGSIHTWAAMTSHSMNEDGISYLDIGDAYIRGDWYIALNSVWSPMYSWILGLVMYIVKPSMHWEFPVVHLVNFALYLVALICFAIFWKQLRQWQQERALENDLILPEWAWLSIGYLLFIWSSLSLIQIWSVTPDMLMAIFVYLAATLVVRIRRGAIAWSSFALLGIVLGLGYLAKAFMFPMGFVFLGMALLTAGNLRRSIPLALVALGIFLLLSSPFIVLISQAKGRFTFSDAGKLTYVRHINHVPYPHWQGETSGNGTPIHPSRKIFNNPPIYEFGSPVGGTYPISYDPSYWYEGVTARFDWQNQAESLIANGLVYLDIFFRQQGVLLISVLILYLMGPRLSLRRMNIVRSWGLSLVALAAFGLYGMVLVAERYIGVFFVLFWADLLAGVSLSPTQIHKRLVAVVSALIVVFMLANLLIFNLQGFVDLAGKANPTSTTHQQAGPPSWPGEVAQTLHQLGVQPGDKVAVIGYAFTSSFWARLARVKIVAEMFDWEAEPFWLGDAETQDRVLGAFADAGAKAIVAENVPGYASLNDWHQVGNSNYYIYILAQ